MEAMMTYQLSPKKMMTYQENLPQISHVYVLSSSL
uniref:Uncharacterized protein n=1 Tax=Arundo donax TaxID=35708 RepID=A0A0A9HSX6_ARUDO